MQVRFLMADSEAGGHPCSFMSIMSSSIMWPWMFSASWAATDWPRRVWNSRSRVSRSDWS